MFENKNFSNLATLRLLVSLLVLVVLWDKVESRYRFNFRNRTLTTTVAPPPPYWSRWGPWQECTQTCGIGVMRRTRLCIHPTQKPKKKKLKVFTSDIKKPCPGSKASIAKNCDTKITCPIHGGWTAWESWECTVSCGGGLGKKSRSCTNPKPMFNGKYCEGNSSHEGTCNEHICPDRIYTLAPETDRSLRDQIQNGYHNLELQVGTKASLPCKKDLVAQIITQYPNANVFWIKNGVLVELNDSRLEMLDSSDMVINNVQATDNGIYVCRMTYGRGVDKPISVVALTVLSLTPTRYVHEKEDLKLHCNGVHLWAVYRNLSHQWLHNEILYQTMTNGTPKDWNILHLGASKNSSGVWSCRVKDLTSNRIWTTNVINVEILPERSLVDQILADQTYLVACCAGILIFFLILVMMYCWVVVKAHANALADFEAWKIIVKLEQKKANGGIPEWASQESSALLPNDGEETTSQSEEEQPNEEARETNKKKRK